jgi:hypothetical protein
MATDIIHGVIGMEEVAAEKFLAAYGLTTRVIERNCECFAFTLDIQSNRVDLYIKNDKIYKVKRG